MLKKIAIIFVSSVGVSIAHYNFDKLKHVLGPTDKVEIYDKIMRVETEDRIFYLCNEFTVSKRKDASRYYLSFVAEDKTIETDNKIAYTVYKKYEEYFYTPH